MNKYEKAICEFLKAANVPDRKLYEREVAAAGISYTLAFHDETLHDETLYAVSVDVEWGAAKAYMLIPEDRRPALKNDGNPTAPDILQPVDESAGETMRALNAEADRVYDVAGARYVGMHPALGMPYGNPTAPDILQRAAQHMQDRAAARDQPGGERSMRRTVDAFNALTGHALSERDGWLFMAVLKMARATTTPAGTPDDYEDLAAYAALAGESAQEKTA